jgi:hypothetical protein
MKKIFLLITITMSAVSGYSQIEKGKKIIGGQFGLSGSNYSRVDSSTSYKSATSMFQINPKIGYFIKDNFAIGVIGNFTISGGNGKKVDINSTSTSKGRSISFGVGGFARYYIKISDKFHFFVNGNILYTHSPYTHLEYTPTSNIQVFTSQPPTFNTISIAVSPGLVYFPSPKLGIEASFGNLTYNYLASKNKTVSYNNHYNSSSYGFTMSPAFLNLGMNYYF